MITQVATTVSTDGDSDTLPQIHQGMADKSLLPSQHLVDIGYMSADLMVQSQKTYLKVYAGLACRTDGPAVLGTSVWPKRIYSIFLSLQS